MCKNPPKLLGKVNVNFKNLLLPNYQEEMNSNIWPWLMKIELQPSVPVRGCLLEIAQQNQDMLKAKKTGYSRPRY